MSSFAADRARLAILLTLGVMFAFSLMDALTKLLAQVKPDAQSLPVVQILWVRSLMFAGLAVALLRMNPATRGTPLRELARSNKPGLQFVRSFLLPVEMALYAYAFSLLPLADVHAVGALTPLLVVALSVPLLGEWIGWRRWLAILVGLCGVLVILRPGMTTLQTGQLITLAGASLWALYQVLVRMCARHDSVETTSVWTAFMMLGTTTALGVLQWVWPTPWNWLLLIGVAILGALAHMTYIKALSMTEPSLLQPFGYTQFVWAIVVGYLIFADVPDRFTLLGAAIIIASGLYAWHRERLRARTSS